MRTLRLKRQTQPISIKEKILVILVGAQCSLAIWAVALTHLQAQLVFAALSLLGFVFCLWPQWVHLRWQDPAQSTTAAWHRLRRFPLFWAGIVLFIYIAIQGLNPAYGYEENPETWRSFPIEHITWLPCSIASPFYKLNPWRILLLLASTWMFLCYAWVGLQRRRVIGFVLWFLFFNALAFCLLVITQKKLGAEGIFWNPEWDPFPNFFGSVPYKNRGAALLYLLMGCSMAHYFFLVRIMRERMQHSGPHLVVLLGILVQYATLWTSFSRGGLAVATGMLLVFFLLVIRTSFQEGDAPILKYLGIAVVFVLVIFGSYAVPRLPDFERTVSRFTDGKLQQEVASGDFNGRGIVTRITLDMIDYRPWFGWGAGSWRFVFPYYQMQHPEIANRPDSKRLLIWDDAHNDWVQYVSELGIVGTPFLLFFILYPLGYVLLWKLRLSRCTHLILATTLVGVFLHSVIELLFQNLSILCLTATVILFLLKLPFNRKEPLRTDPPHSTVV